jgi:two-component system phosphate regulon sensor histidine kinase PhoR
VVQHPAGSLDVAVATWRTRNLAMSFGLLGILAASIGLVFSVMRRAEKLARLQVEFVASVSHELCTPLAVISGAAENLADGIVDEPARVREYAGMIRDQGRRLEHLVDQSLSIAAGKLAKAELNLRPIQIAPVILQCMTLSAPILRDANFEVEEKISADLPPVIADADAVGKCMENLISNAVKYSGPKRRVAVRAEVVDRAPAPELQVSVEDKGIGISPSDLSNIFEPFYRVLSPKEGQVRGAGLGLYLVKQMMERMGGTVTVASELGRGTSFVLHFPIVDPGGQLRGQR